MTNDDVTNDGEDDDDDDEVRNWLKPIWIMQYFDLTLWLVDVNACPVCSLPKIMPHNEPTNERNNNNKKTS